MIQIDDVVISFDVFREKFLCNLDACKGECCIEGDAGAPVELEEVEKLEEVLPVIWDELSPGARAVIDKQGVVYTDEEGDLVTSIVNHKDCVFTCYDEKGYCYCAIEKAFRAGKTDFYKPISCHLYPIRIGDYGPYKAVSYTHLMMNGENTFQSRPEIDAVGLVTIFRHLSKTDNEKHHKDDNTDC